MEIDKDEIIRILHILTKTAKCQIESSNNEKNAIYWNGIKCGLETAKYLITYGKPPQTTSDTIIAENIGEHTLH